jgi:hypothetical protein
MPPAAFFSVSVMALTTLIARSGAGRSEEEKKPSPRTEDAMIVFDASRRSPA